MQETKEIEVGGNMYQLGRLDAMKQFHVSRRLVPVLASFSELGEAFKAKDGDESMNIAALLPLGEAIAKLSDADAEYIIKTCLGVVKRLDKTSDRYTALMVRDQFAYQDLSMVEMVRLTGEVVMENMGDFFSGLQAP